jgi:hypothetical protein
MANSAHYQPALRSPTPRFFDLRQIHWPNCQRIWSINLLHPGHSRREVTDLLTKDTTIADHALLAHIQQVGQVGSWQLLNKPGYTGTPSRAISRRLFDANDPESTGIARFWPEAWDDKSPCGTTENRKQPDLYRPADRQSVGRGFKPARCQSIPSALLSGRRHGDSTLNPRVDVIRIDSIVKSDEISQMAVSVGGRRLPGTAAS